MPKVSNKTIFLNAINSIESELGFVIANREDIVTQITSAWESDKTDGKLDFLSAYREVFKSVLKQTVDHEIERAYVSNAERLPDLKKCLFVVDRGMKMGAMALIPALRQNKNQLANMTFSAIKTQELAGHFVSLVKNNIENANIDGIIEKHKSECYEVYRADWLDKNAGETISLIVGKHAKQDMSKSEKINYTIAVAEHFKYLTKEKKLNEAESSAFKTAVDDWMVEIGCNKNDSLDEYIGNSYRAIGAQISNEESIKLAIVDAAAEYRNQPDPIASEIEHFNNVEESLNAEKQIKETTIKNEEISDESLGMVADLFNEATLSYELENMHTHKEREFLYNEIEDINNKYGLNISPQKFLASIEQVSGLMVKAREEKDVILSDKGITVLENGREIVYNAKNYRPLTQEYIDKYEAGVKTLNKERGAWEKKNKELLAKIDKSRNSLDPSDGSYEELKKSFDNAEADAKITHSKEVAGFDKRFEEMKATYEREISSVRGGLVIDKTGDKPRSYKSKEYYEIRETNKERVAHSEYKKMFVSAYEKACSIAKERDYQAGKVTDFGKIAKELDAMFKKGLYVSNVYDDAKNFNFLTKCNFGGCSAEELAAISVQAQGGEWSKNNTSNEAWTKQISQAKTILLGWKKQLKEDRNLKPASLIKAQLNEKRQAFRNNNISRKEMLDYMIAADAHLQNNYTTRRSRIFSFIQYRREKRAIEECRNELKIGKGVSLRMEMGAEYTKMGNQMTKENIYKSIEKTVNNIEIIADKGKELKQQHNALQDKIRNEKQAELDKLNMLGRVPIKIPELDERNVILNQGPRVPPVAPVQPQQNLVAHN